MDQGPGRRAPRLRRPAGRTAEPDHPAEDPDYADLGPAFPAWTGTHKDTILQPPKPEIPPSARILDRVVDRDLEMEAAN